MFDRLRSARSKNRQWFGQGCRQEDISDAEEQLRCILPEDFKVFALEFGWIDSVRLQVSGLGRGIPQYLNIVDETIVERKTFEPNLPTHLIPVSNDGAGNHFCLDTSSQDMPSIAPVVFFAHDAAEGSEQSTAIIANSFEAWIEAEALTAFDA